MSKKWPGRSLKACDDVVGALSGLSYSHRLGDLLPRGESLTTSNFHPHWHIHNESVGAIDRPMTMLEPVTVSRIRKNDSKKGGTGKHGNRREPLFAERILQATPAQGRSRI